MQIKFEILKKGDSVLNVWDNYIAVKKKSGEVEIYQFFWDEQGFPRLADNTILVTQGSGNVTAKGDDSNVEVFTF